MIRSSSLWIGLGTFLWLGIMGLVITLESGASPKQAPVVAGAATTAARSATEVAVAHVPAPPPPEARPFGDAHGDPAKLFQAAGCFACHQKGAPYNANIVAARTKPADELAAWILSPRPGALMPPYAGRLTEEDVQALAEWIRAGNPPD